MLEHQTGVENAKPQPAGKLEQSEARPRVDLLAGLSPRASGESSAQAHASTFYRAGAQPTLASHSLLQLQRQYGNQYVQRVLALARSGEGENEVAPDVEGAIERSRGGGQALDVGVRGQMQSAFGVDFGGVRVHTGAESHALNCAVNAVAFTTGSDIFFSDGAYSPESSGGRELLAHELTHVVQQGATSELVGQTQGSAVQRMCPECEKEKNIQPKLAVGRSDDQYEQEAERVAKLVSGNKSEAVNLDQVHISADQISRQPEDDQDLPPGYPDNQWGQPTVPVAPDPHVAPYPTPQPTPDQGPYRTPGQRSDDQPPDSSDKQPQGDSAQRLRQILPGWVIALLGAAALVALAACVASGICEAAAIIGFAGAAAAVVIIAALRSAGIGVHGDDSA
jgi:hypothetical protein